MTQDVHYPLMVLHTGHRSKLVHVAKQVPTVRVDQLQTEHVAKQVSPPPCKAYNKTLLTDKVLQCLEA